MNPRITPFLKNARIGLVSLSLLATGLAQPLIRDQATPYARPSTVPEASAVIMRTLRFRPFDAKDPQDTFRALDEFHVTRLEWTYLSSAENDASAKTATGSAELEKVARVRASGRIFGGASGSSHGTLVTSTEQGGNPTKNYTVVDRSGKPAILGHTRYWKDPASAGCVNDPEYRRRHLEYLKRYLAAGATTLQRDEPGTQVGFASSGAGCFCANCMDGFRKYLADKVPEKERRELGVEEVGTFNYRDYLNGKSPVPPSPDFDWSDPQTVKRVGGPLHRHFVDFQMTSTTEFFQWIRRELTVANHGIPVGYSCNNTSFQNWEDPYVGVFDYGNSEMMMQSANPGHIYERAQKALAMGKMQVFGTPKTMGLEINEAELVRLKQRVIATTYASGAMASVPWDLFLQSKDGTARYFGRPEDFAGIYGMVRASHKYLEEYCTAGARGPGIKDNRFGNDFPVVADSSAEGLCIFLRAVPGNSAAPIVIHVVDWNKSQAMPTALKLRDGAFFPGKRLTVTLRTPSPYNGAAHQAAEQRAQTMRKSGERLGASQAEAYDPLVSEVQLRTQTDGGFTQIYIPALNPWAMLIVRAAN